MKRLAFIILVSAVFAACTKKSNQIDTNDIYQVIRIEYHEDINQTHVKYKLKRKKESGASIEFVDGDQVSIMGIIQSYEGAGSYPYEAEFYNFIDSVYTTVTHKGTTINNYGLIGNVYAIQIPSTLTVYKNYSWYFTWTGMPIMGSNDEIKIEIINSANSVVLTQKNRSSDYNDITIYSSQMNDLSGYHKIRVTRTREMPLIMTTGSGGRIEMVYIDEDYVNFI